MSKSQMMKVKGKLYRVFGVSLGLAILGSVFFLPFSFRGSRPLTLYEIAVAITENWREMPRLADPVMTLNYVFLAVFALLIVSGLSGFFPLISGIVGVFSMTVLSVSLSLFGFQIALGSGFYILWTLCLVIIGFGIWHTLYSK